VNASPRDWQALHNTLILLLLLSFCVYLPTILHYAFADDDIYLAYMNQFLREAPWTDLYKLFLKPQNPWEFLPLRDFTYWLDFRLYGDETSGFHVTNLIWYAASGVASFVLFRELILLCRPAWSDRANVLSLCGLVLFVVHPAHVEVAAWIASRKDLIAGTLGCLALALLTRAIRRDWICSEIFLSALLLFLACFGKAAAMTNILLVSILIGVGHEASPAISKTRKISIMLMFWLVTVVVYLIHLNVGQSTGILIENHPGVLVMIERASRILTALIGILLFPYPLRFYYDVYLLGDWHWLVSASAVLFLLFSIFSMLRKRSLWSFGVALMLSPMVIYLQLLPFTTWSLASERFVFVSVAGLVIVLIDFFARLNNPKLIGWIVLSIVLPSALTVWSRIDDWGGGRAALLDYEYKLQPDFHNAIRDRIGFTLLPEMRYIEAQQLAHKLQRPYATDGLLALIDADQAYRQVSDTKSASVAAENGALRLSFCSAVKALRSATRNGYAHIPNEPDVSYNNILRSLDQQLKYHFADAKVLCVDNDALPELLSVSR
jgi:hypothetical protein